MRNQNSEALTWEGIENVTILSEAMRNRSPAYTDRGCLFKALKSIDNGIKNWVWRVLRKYKRRRFIGEIGNLESKTVEQKGPPLRQPKNEFHKC